VQHSSKAFTLIELLTVIAIIGVLMSLLFPAVGAAQTTARKAQAQNDIVQLVTATKAYYTEYGHYPLGPTQVALAWNTVFGDPDGIYSSADLCNVLRAIPDNKNNPNNLLNPKQIVFLEGNTAKNSEHPKSGFAPKDAQGPAGKIKQGAFVDPWGAEYVLFIDGSYRNDVSSNGGLEWFYWGTSPALSVHKDIAGVSLGPDSAWGKKGNGNLTGSDDVATW
jgi:prepilin-type N-terminal cleavage/methylation domain-containing protein